ncbi:acetyltransferase (GNAT) family protein [Aquimarina sp. MAR_2010_214]|uniref:GNAT family N-acetyltransferase n=1 Tax=Aquimarina sp. MAR_2010_214 TaxID=1250026 RepID=UPI000CB20F20|nr:GNAT family N-acetyltransferase [Aquimarina sp. MAR_2010_214]PKV50998.1 acetyltransferase (GNAT) family protein [Aquimarina sp. MAR_2010_214]
MEIIEDKKRWGDLLSEVDRYDFYHTYDYHHLSKSDEEKPILVWYEDKGKIIGLPLLIRKIFDTNYFDVTSVYGYAGPISKNIDSSFDNEKYQNELHHFFLKNNIVSVFTRLNPFVKNQEIVLNGIGEIKQLSQIVTIDLSKEVDIQKHFFSKTTKRYINKARKLCFVKTGRSKEDIKIFMELYYENMDRVKAKKHYYFNEDYFHEFINSDDFETDILFVSHKETEEVISAAMMVKSKDVIHYHISGTKNDFLYLTPIRLLIDEARIQGTRDDYKYFNLGGGLGSTEDNLFKFKSSFSKDFENFKIWKYIVNEQVYDQLSCKYVNGKDKNDFFPEYRNL